MLDLLEHVVQVDVLEQVDLLDVPDLLEQLDLLKCSTCSTCSKCSTCSTCSTCGGGREAPVALGAPGVWHEAPVVLSAALGAPGLALGTPGGWREALVALPVLSGERDALVALDGERATPYDDFIDSEDSAPCRVYIVVPCFEDWVYSTYHDVMASTRQRRWLRAMASKEFETCTQFALRTRVVAVRAPHPRDGEPSGPSAASASGGRAGERRRH